jgi:hypothetical protein
MPHTRKHILTGRRPSLKRTAHHSRRAPPVGGSSIYKTIVPTFLHMLNTVKLYHWKTLSYATHKATDDLYGKLNDKLDDFVEVMLGKGAIAGGANRANYIAFKKQIDYYITFLLNLSNNTTFNVPANVDLLAIRDEIVANFNQFLYLLTLH